MQEVLCLALDKKRFRKLDLKLMTDNNLIGIGQHSQFL